MVSPSNEDILTQNAEFLRKIEKLDKDKDSQLIKKYKEKLENYNKKCQGCAYGETAHAIWQLTKQPATIPQKTILDIALIRPEIERIGTNILPVAQDRPFPGVVYGTGEPVGGMRICKVGRTTGYSEGIIGKDWMVYKHQNFDDLIAFRTVRGVNTRFHAPGDSGSLLINESGRVVGMTNGGLRTKSTGVGSGNVEMEIATFIPSGDILGWAEVVLGEEVEFLCSN